MVSRCFPGGYNVKLYISRGRLAWWLLAFLHSDSILTQVNSSEKCLFRGLKECSLNTDGLQTRVVLIMGRFDRIGLHSQKAACTIVLTGYLLPALIPCTTNSSERTHIAHAHDRVRNKIDFQ